MDEGKMTTKKNEMIYLKVIKFPDDSGNFFKKIKLEKIVSEQLFN